MISLTPLKLLNLAQMVLISRLLLHRNTDLTLSSSQDRGSSVSLAEKVAQSKAKVNVMIFLGKHTPPSN